MTPADRGAEDDADDVFGRPGWTFTDNLRLMRRLPLLLQLLAVAIPSAALGVALLPQPWKPLPGTLIGVPVMAWILRRAQDREGPREHWRAEK